MVKIEIIEKLKRGKQRFDEGRKNFQRSTKAVSNNLNVLEQQIKQANQSMNVPISKVMGSQQPAVPAEEQTNKKKPKRIILEY